VYVKKNTPHSAKFNCKPQSLEPTESIKTNKVNKSSVAINMENLENITM